MDSSQQERLVAAWEGVEREIGEFNELLRTAIAKQWPEARQPREGIISRVPTAEDKIKAQTGNTDGPIDEWLGEFDSEEEIGPREKEFLAKQARRASRSKASAKAGGQDATGVEASRRRSTNAPIFP